MTSDKSELLNRGSEETSPHGIPRDLLDRLLIIPTVDYSVEELKKVGVHNKHHLFLLFEVLLFFLFHLPTILSNIV